MYIDQEAVIEEVRTLTGYTDRIVSDESFTTLFNMAYKDIEGIVGQDLETVENIAAERAVFWSVCLFAKVHAGELGGIDFKIGSLNVQQFPRRDITRVWYRNLDQQLEILRREGGGMGLTNVSRNDRVYGE